MKSTSQEITFLMLKLEIEIERIEQKHFNECKVYKELINTLENDIEATKQQLNQAKDLIAEHARQVDELEEKLKVALTDEF